MQKVVMRKCLGTVLGVAAVLAAGSAWGSAFRVPEQSLDSVARAGAYGALPVAADAGYYNPAAMSWLADGWQVEASLLYINLPSISYSDTNPANNGSSKDEQFLLPNVHLVSPAHGRWRFGFSLVYPFGLSKRWEAAFPRSTAEDFTLKTYEANPTVACRLSDSLSLGVGLRLIYAEGEVRSQATLPGPTVLRRDLEGDTTEIGWNAALSFRPSERLALALTYRSQVDLDLEGDARIVLNAPVYTGAAEVTVATPDVLTISGAYTWGDTTVELTWDRTFWSAYDQLDFNYTVALTTISPFLANFDNPLPKNWEDSDAFRISVSHRLDGAWTVMAGAALDETPVPDATLGFELPDADALIFSLGVTYRPSDRLAVALSYLYDRKESRTVNTRSAASPFAPSGTFDDGGAHLVSAGIRYRF